MSLHSSKVPFSRIDNTSCPAMSTGVGPRDLAVPLTQTSWFTTNTLLSANGPSMVAVRLGASRTSRVNDSLDGLRWCSGTAITGSNCSTHPSNHNSALITPNVSVSSNSTLIDHEPDGVTIPLRLFVPLKLETNVKKMLGGSPAKA